MQQQGSVAPIFCVSLMKNWSDPKCQILGLITTSLDPLYLPELLLLMEFWFLKTLVLHFAPHYSFLSLDEGHLSFLVTATVLSNYLKYSSRTIIGFMLVFAKEIASNLFS